ncbi:hypothetical protein L6R53_15140 [Myxococcota bacterium]|nr:hypothetical protein [Myxococcota bacterium]
MQQVFLDRPDSSLKRGYELRATGVSYEDTVPCKEWQYYLNQDWRFPVKRGEQPGHYIFEVSLTIPADDIKDILGEHDDGGAFLFNPRFAANQVYIGWHDGESYHWVDSLPQGWTDSKVCIEAVSVDHLKATVLFDPLDGPYTRNEHNNLQQPIWFELEAWATGFDSYKYPHTCLATVWSPSSTKQLFFGD